MKWLPLIILLVGCNSTYTPPAAPETTPVSGKVYLPNGSPLTGGRIVFKPKENGWQEASGEIGTDGTFKLSSYNKDDGARVGEYIVHIDKTSFKTGQAVTVRADVPKKYLGDASDLVVSVTSSQTDYPIRLK